MKYRCTDVSEPNLYKDVFPYEALPVACFDHAPVQMDIPDTLWVTDTTLRDGQQSMRAFTARQSLELYHYLHRIDNGCGVIRQAEFFVYNENDREALIEAQKLGYDYPEITTWIRADERDFALIRDLGVKETGMLMSCSDYHIFHKLKLTRTQTMEKYLSVAEAALKAGIKPRCHLEDITRADFEGFVIPLVKNLKDLCDSYGMPLKIRACDTLGVGVPFPTAPLPRSVPAIISCLRKECGLAPESIEWHGHNDFHLAVANSMAAWLYGAASVNTTLLGIGERCGNTPLEGMLFQYAQIKGAGNLKLEVFNEVAEYFAHALEFQVHEKYPILGADFNTTKAGIHADGLLKDPEIYNAFNTQKILNRPIVIMINQASGLSGIAGWINNYYHLEEDKTVQKHDPRVLKIKDWVDREYTGGRTSNITNEELNLLVEKYLPEIALRKQGKKMAFTELTVKEKNA